MKTKLLTLMAFSVLASSSFAEDVDFYSQFDDMTLSSNSVKSDTLSNSSFILGSVSPELKRKASQGDLAITSLDQIDIGYGSDEEESVKKKAVESREKFERELINKHKPTFVEKSWATVKSATTFVVSAVKKAYGFFKSFF